MFLSSILKTKDRKYCRTTNKYNNHEGESEIRGNDRWTRRKRIWEKDKDIHRDKNKETKLERLSQKLSGKAKRQTLNSETWVIPRESVFMEKELNQ